MKPPCGRPRRLRRLRGGRLSGVIEALQTQVLLTFELPEAGGLGGEFKSRNARQDAYDRRTEVPA